MKKLVRSRPGWLSSRPSMSIRVSPIAMSKCPASSNTVQCGSSGSSGSSFVGVRQSSGARPGRRPPPARARLQRADRGLVRPHARPPCPVGGPDARCRPSGAVPLIPQCPPGPGTASINWGDDVGGPPARYRDRQRTTATDWAWRPPPGWPYACRVRRAGGERRPGPAARRLGVLGARRRPRRPPRHCPQNHGPGSHSSPGRCRHRTADRTAEPTQAAPVPPGTVPPGPRARRAHAAGAVLAGTGPRAVPARTGAGDLVRPGGVSRARGHRRGGPAGRARGRGQRHHQVPHHHPQPPAGEPDPGGASATSRWARWCRWPCCC